jgi:2-dehydropantoate 2-reductase
MWHRQVMRFIVYGAGGIGGVIGGRLFEHGHDVVLIARGAHFEALHARGLELRSAASEVVLPVDVVDHPGAIDMTDDDVVLLTMKTQDTLDAVDALGATAPPGIAVVCAQNGVENERLALRRFPNVYGMCVMCPTAHTEPGVVEAHADPIAGLLDVGRYPAGLDDTAKAVADALSSSTFESVPRADIMRWKYAKLLMNLGNSVEALCGHADGAGEIARRARSEGAAVLRAAGIDVASQDEDRRRRGDLLQSRPPRATPRGGGSTWQSLRRGTGRVEADYLNGEIALVGRSIGMDTPVNALLQRLANEAARKRVAPGSTSPATILAMLDGA